MSNEIAIAWRETPLGLLLVAGSRRGVCLVRFGTGRAALEAALVREVPAAALVRGAPHVERWADALADACTGRPGAETIPLDVAGSRFQRRVWDALRRIPCGATRSYGEIAARLGAPRAARAVASACAANPVALAVPCHRVVPRSGGPGGYRYGAARKRALLAAEARTRSS